MWQKIIWILLADAHSARILEWIDGRDLIQIKGGEFLIEELFDLSADTDRPGRVIQGGRHKDTLDSRQSSKDNLQEGLIREVCRKLEIAFDAKKFDRLIIAAAPATLGVIRKIMNDKIKSVVDIEVNRELNRFSTRELLPHLAPYL